jgi:asparagine synthase (glutamine-hydrolysing)
MPGIFGFIAPSVSEGRAALLSRMSEGLKHEPFYSSGSLVLEDFGLGIGWVSLQGSFSDCLPIWNDRQDIGLILTGEHFASPSDLELAGEPGRVAVAGDARWLTRLYERAGDKFFERLNGTLSGLLIDRRNQKLILFNDRYGLSRIYFHEAKEGFYFASEAKSLLRILPELRNLNLTSFGELISCGCTLQGRTLFSGVNLLPGGAAWSFAPGRAVSKQSYFTRDNWERQSRLPEAEYYQQLNETFTRVLPRYFQGQNPIALSLTGGLDSRMIIAAAPVAAGGLPCYTFGGMYRECADVQLARQIAEVCGQRHEVIPVNSKFFPEFPELARQTIFRSDGAMDVMGSVELFVNRIARELAPTRMTGNYGSEVLRANVAFKPMPLNNGIFDPVFAGKVAGSAQTYAEERRSPAPSFIAFKQVPWHHYARMSLEQSKLIARSPFLDNEIVALSYRAPAELSVNKTVAHRYIGEHKPALASIPTDRGVIGPNGVAKGKLGHFCQEFMPRAEYTYDYGMPQWLAKIDRWMSPLHVERLFLGRQKFYHFRIWYRNELSGYVRDMLLDRRTLSRPYLHGPTVEKIVRAHVSGSGNYTLEIHKLLSAELIQRELIERN